MAWEKETIAWKIPTLFFLPYKVTSGNNFTFPSMFYDSLGQMFGHAILFSRAKTLIISKHFQNMGKRNICFVCADVLTTLPTKNVRIRTQNCGLGCLLELPKKKDFAVLSILGKPPLPLGEIVRGWFWGDTGPAHLEVGPNLEFRSGASRSKPICLFKQHTFYVPLHQE